MALFFSLFLSALADPTWTFPDPLGHCVAWKTRKKMFLLQTVRPVGLNCAIQALRKQNSAGVTLSIRAPLKNFHSESEPRDQAVKELLQAEKHPDIVIETATLGPQGIESLYNQPHGVVSATLSFAGKSFPIEVPYQIEAVSGTRVLKGSLSTTFTAFGLEPPQVAGGVVASVKDELELHYQIKESEIK